MNLDKTERVLFNKINNVSSIVINNLNESNIKKLYDVFMQLEKDVKRIVHSEKKDSPQIWMQFSSMTEDEIRQEFNNTEKYPDIESIKAAIKGYVEMRKLSKVKNRETIIEHIINTEEGNLSLTSVGNQLRINEYDIHTIILTHPYLLGHEFENLSLKHEKLYVDRTRADFIFSDNYTSIVVEVKIGPLDIYAIEQAEHYLEKERDLNTDVELSGILIGSKPLDEINFQDRIEHSKFIFRIMILGDDFPKEIKLCGKSKCKKANPLSVSKCNYCGSKKFIKDPFMFK